MDWGVITSEVTDLIEIITDSTCDIPPPLLDQYRILVVPQIVIWGTEQYGDRVDIQPQEFYRRLQSDPLLPHSSMPRLQDIHAAFATATARGADSILVLTISSAMSGTYQLIKRVAEEYPLPIEVVDAKGPTMSLGWQVLAAARARDAGADLHAIVDVASRVRERLVQIVGMETLKYLKTGGRIGHAAIWAGTLLKVKPVVSINHRTGLVEPVAICRTHQAMVGTLYRAFFDRVGKAKLRIAVLHGQAPEGANQLAERIRAEFPPTELLVNMTGPVLGINTGPGALALCGYADES